MLKNLLKSKATKRQEKIAELQKKANKIMRINGISNSPSFHARPPVTGYEIEWQ